ncbi:MAG: hypothetical protein EOO73_05360 [Myxococcales bacterium]|nr:MAG: hypothetical protein EOO73_05360 [Myxococcales bacterium]
MNGIQRWGSWLLMKQFRLREFSALLGVEDAAGLSDLLKRGQEHEAYADVIGLHALRWMLIEPHDASGVRSIDPAEPKALLLSFVCDGSVDATLDAVLNHRTGRAREILSHCRAFDQKDPAGYLRAHALTGKYMFRDLGPLAFPPRVRTLFSAPSGSSTFRGRVRAIAQVLFLQEPDLEPDVTISEIREAFEVRDRFFEFWDSNAGADAHQLRRSFVRAFQSDGFPLALTPFERRLPNEESWVRRTIDTGTKLQDRTARRAGDGKVRRAIHSKGHGLIRARFRVFGDKEAQGLFAVEGTYDAVLRPSNGAEAVKKDGAGDARGLALRVVLPPGTMLGGNREPEFFHPPRGAEGGCQDFLLMSASEFFTPDVASLAKWFRVRELEGRARNVALAAMLLVPGGVSQSLLMYRALWNRPLHPLAGAFHSATCYQYGPHHLAKYSVEPLDRERFRRIARQQGADALKQALRDSLRDGPILLNFFVHVLRADAPLPQGLAIPDIVEDACFPWERLGAKKLHVASIEISRQDPGDPPRLLEAEQLQFNPWNALHDHRPLGSLNRARWGIYPASQSNRSHLEVSREAMADAAE